jgi:hypothetical protein
VRCRMCSFSNTYEVARRLSKMPPSFPRRSYQGAHAPDLIGWWKQLRPREECLDKF